MPGVHCEPELSSYEPASLTNDLHPLTVDRRIFFFLMHILVLIDHQPYGMIVLWVSLLLTAHSWS